MSINENWEYERTRSGLRWTVDAVGVRQNVSTIAAFPSRTQAENYAGEAFKLSISGPGYGYAVVDTENDFVVWTSF